MPLLQVSELAVGFDSHPSLVRGVNFSVEAGETLAIVGESGSGKSLSMLAVLGLLPADMQIRGEIHFDGQKINGLTQSQLRQLRGAQIGYVSQDPLTNLHPLKSVGEQIGEAIAAHHRMSKKDRRQRVLALLDEVGIKDAERQYHARPAAFSGGMRQRVMIAIAIALNPKLIIADEPTTALDVTVQAAILQLIKKLQARHGCALIFISHDLRVVADIADRVVVMKQGQIIEQAKSTVLFNTPQHAYTRSLIEACWQDIEPLQRLPASGPLLLKVHQLARGFRSSRLLFRKRTEHKVLRNVSFDIHAGEIVGLVGESGSGKTTLGRIVAGLDVLDSGSVTLNAQPWQQVGHRPPSAAHAHRYAIQIIFQDPYSSLNVRRRIGDILTEPLQLTAQREGRAGYSKNALRVEVEKLLNTVELAGDMANRYPSQLSGGQRQRVAIARALAMKPKLIVADEAVSALDVTTQLRIIQLLIKLRDEQSLSLLFISHDLSAVAALSDRVLILRDGEIIEEGSGEQIFRRPQHRWTRELLGAIPGQHSRPLLAVSEI